MNAKYASSFMQILKFLSLNYMMSHTLQSIIEACAKIILLFFVAEFLYCHEI
ncbi:MAG: hypothetical protein HKN67_13810 [Saprospiraceae bacterium]|nr:hypothetical protein [Saprospiraceae bacterium]